MSIRHWAWLSGVTNASPKARAALCAYYGGAEQAFHAPPGDYRKVPGLTENEAALFEARDLSAADRILADCEREGIELVTLQDARYPARLKSIFAPPVVLYVKGRLPDVDGVPSVAVIGTRKATPYGLKMGRDIAFEIVRCGGIVVSGLTEGVDRAAARGCLLAGGTCIGVLGTCHGSEGGLSRDVFASGALVSEVPPGTPPLKRFFRERNRISSGLSHAVCVVEAPEQSGCMLFVHEALEQGREIFAVPGNADAENSAGTIALLKQGARPAVCGWDVMEDFADVYPGRVHRPGNIVLPDDGAAAAENTTMISSSAAKILRISFLRPLYQELLNHTISGKHCQKYRRFRSSLSSAFRRIKPNCFFPLHFSGGGCILPVSFSGEGKHAVREPAHRERGKVQARSRS